MVGWGNILRKKDMHRLSTQNIQFAEIRLSTLSADTTKDKRQAAGHAEKRTVHNTRE
jgi:hypothetical protein